MDRLNRRRLLALGGGLSPAGLAGCVLPRSGASRPALIMVLSHERCGAVAAAVAGGLTVGHIAGLVHALRPAVERTRGAAGDPVENAVNANVQIVVENLRQTGPILAEAAQSGQIKIVGGRYDLDTGVVTLIA